MNIFDQFDDKNEFDQFDQPNLVGKVIPQGQAETLSPQQQQQIYQSDVPTFSESGQIIKQPPKPQASLEQKTVGVGEAGLSMATGATAGTGGLIYGTLKGLANEIRSGNFGTQEAADRVEQMATQYANKMTYEPKTEEGMKTAQELGTFVGQYLQPLTGLAGEMQNIGNSAREASPAMHDLKSRILNKSREEQFGMHKAAGAEAVESAVTRQQTAENLPVPVKLTTGAVTRTAEQLAFEKEMMKSPKLGAPLRVRSEENNLQILQNFDELIDQTGAQAMGPVNTGNIVIDSLSSGYKAARKKTQQAYLKANNSQEAKTPVDTTVPVMIGTKEEPISGTLWDYINSKPQGVESTKVVDSARAIAEKLGIAKKDDAGNLVPNKTTIKNLEDFRREISGVANIGDRTGLRDETIMKKIIDKSTEGVGGKLYKEARALRTQQARKYENRAIVARLISNIRGMDDPKVPADLVFRKSILNSSPEEITFLKRVMQTSGNNGKQAWKELQGSTIRYIQDEATKGMGMDSHDHPLVSPAKLHNTVTALDSNGRLEITLGKKRAEIIRDLNDVSRYINTTPPGTLINNSGTAGMILAAISEAGTYGATMGVPVPVITALKFLRDQVKETKIKNKIDSALKGLESKSK